MNGIDEKAAKMAEEDIKAAEMLNSAVWAANNQIRLANNQIFSFEDRPYQFEPMSSQAPEKVYMKATGGGFSEGEILDTLHGLIYGRYQQGVGYYFPTDGDMQDYSKSRFGPLILYNYGTIGQYVKTRGRGSDSASFKRVGSGNLYLRGATLKPSDDGTGAKKSTKATGIQIDKAVLDEVDQMDSELLAKVRGRMGNAAIDGIKGKKQVALIANPSDVNFGIDLHWQESSQKYWFRRCANCGEWLCAELEFPKYIEKYSDWISRETAGMPVGYIACKKCGKPLGLKGQWVKTKEGRAKEGWHWSHLTSNYHDPIKILEHFEHPPENNLGDVYRLELGLPYTAREDVLTKQEVYACCGNDIMLTYHKGPCIMGVDVKRHKNVVIGIRTGKETFEVLLVARVKGFSDVHDLAKRFNVRFAVVDMRPYEDAARQFQKSESYRVFLCEYVDSPLQDVQFNDDTGVVKAFRTGILDTTHRLITNRQIIFPRQCPEMDEFAEQCCRCVKSKMVDKKKNQIVYRYKTTGSGKDDYRHALNYFAIAGRKGRIISRRNQYRQLQKTAKHHTTLI
jgi:hypothetical protein